MIFERNLTRGNGDSPFLSVDFAANPYPVLSTDTACDVLILCDGIGGLVIAQRLLELGVSVCVADAAGIGFGSERYNGGMVQYDMGMSLSALRSCYGTGNALALFRRFSESLDLLEAIVRETGSPCDFVRRDCFLFTEKDADVADTEDCYIARRHSGFRVEYWDKSMGMEHFSFPFSAGIYSVGLGAELNPVRFSVDLAAYLSLHGVQIFENTEMRSVFAEDNVFVCHSPDHYVIRAKTVIDARTVQKTARHDGHCLFYVASAPVSQFHGWYNKCLLRNRTQPSHSLRTTADDRLIIAGERSRLLDATGKIAGIPAAFYGDYKYGSLSERLQDMFIGIEGIEPEFYFCETSRIAPGRLPSVGALPQLPQFFEACFGGEHLLLQAVLAGELLRRLVAAQPDPLEAFFAPKQR